MWESVSTLKLRTDSSKLFTQLRTVVWESVYPSVAPLSRVIMAVYGQQRMTVRELRFYSPFLADPRVRRATVTATFGRLPSRTRREKSMIVICPLVSVVDD